MRPSEGSVEKICVLCKKPVQVKLKEVKSKWGNDWKHKECWLKQVKVNRNGSYF